MFQLDLSKQRIMLDSVASTNSHALDLLKSGKVVNGLTVLTHHQTAGKGQRGNSWNAEPGMNLTCSIIVTGAIPVSKSFYLNMIASLSVVDFCHDSKLQAQVKWPNDILSAGLKLGGILIENQVRGNQITASVLGFGINVNQMDFGDLPATSIKSVLHQEMNIDQVWESIHTNLAFYFGHLMNQNYSLVRKNYMANLAGLNEPRIFADSDGKFEGTIIDIDESGLLCIKRSEGIRKYAFKEVSWIAN